MKKTSLSVSSSAGENSQTNNASAKDPQGNSSIQKDTNNPPGMVMSPVKQDSSVKEDTKSISSSSPVTKSGQSAPIKTVIMVDTHAVTKSDEVISSTLTNQKQDSDSIASSSSTGASQMSDSEEGMEDSPVIEKTVRKRRVRSPTPPPSHDRRVELEKQLRAEEIVEYENLKGISIYKKFDNENSDTDSGVGGEADKQVVVIQNSIPERSTSMEESDDGESWETTDDTGVGMSVDSGSGTALSRFTELHLDLSKY